MELHEISSFRERGLSRDRICIQIEVLKLGDRSRAFLSIFQKINTTSALYWLSSN